MWTVLYNILLCEYHNVLLLYRYEKLEGKQFSAADADYFVFHSPYNKVVYLKLFRVYNFFFLLSIRNYVVLKNNVYPDKKKCKIVCLNFLLKTMQLVQKSFARLVFSDYLRNARFLYILHPLIVNFFSVIPRFICELH